MTETNPKYHKIITRDGAEATTVTFGEWEEQVSYTSDWYQVDGGKGVKARNWIISRLSLDVDGADITIEAGGYTPIQLVKAANVVVDTPESGEAYCIVMNLDGTVHVNHFKDTDRAQMVWTQGMIITWIAKSAVRLTEFEDPSYQDDMFQTVPEDSQIFQGRDMTFYLKTVQELRLTTN